jgi:hypothetical protein
MKTFRSLRHLQCYNPKFPCTKNFQGFMEETCVKPTLKPYACPIVYDHLHLYVTSWLYCLWSFSFLMQLLYIVIFFFMNVFIRTLMCCIFRFWFFSKRLQGVSKHNFCSFQSLFLSVFARTLMLLFCNFTSATWSLIDQI